MRKTYLEPKLEIKQFDAENIATISGVAAYAAMTSGENPINADNITVWTDMLDFVE